MDSAFSTTSPLPPDPIAAGEALRDRHLVALHEVVGAVARQTDPRATLNVIAEKARVLTQAASAAVSLLNSSRTLLDFAAVAGADAAEIVGQTVRVEDALAGRTALTGELYLIHHPDAAADETNSADPSVAVGVGVRSAIVVPVYLGGRAVRRGHDPEPHGWRSFQRQRSALPANPGKSGGAGAADR